MIFSSQYLLELHQYLLRNDYTSQVYRSLISGITTVLRQEGVRGLYRGLVPAISQVAPQMGLQFGFYSLFTGFWNKMFYNQIGSTKGEDIIKCCTLLLDYQEFAFKKIEQNCWIEGIKSVI